jgi:hypothetical protein
MRFVIRCVITAAFVGLTLGGCSSDESPGNTDGGAGGTGSGGKGSGGDQSTGGSVSMCEADAGNDGCRKCMGRNCCSDYTACVRDPVCNKAVDTHADCVEVPGAENAACFGDLTRELQGDAAGLHPITLCMLNGCSAACAAPGPV